MEPLRDRSSTKDSNKPGLIIKTLQEKKQENTFKFTFKASNNEAEYEVQIDGIELCYTTNANFIKSCLDSQLVVNQLNGEYETMDGTMTAYIYRVREATS